MSVHTLPAESALQFILAGDAYFTVKNSNTGNFMAFHFIKGKNPRYPKWYIEVKKGAVVETSGDDKDGNWVYLGAFENGIVKLTPKSRVERGSTELLAIDYIMRMLLANTVPSHVTFFRHSWCGCCGLALNDELSVVTGYGDTCWKKMTGEKRSTSPRKRQEMVDRILNRQPAQRTSITRAGN